MQQRRLLQIWDGQPLSMKMRLPSTRMSSRLHGQCNLGTTSSHIVMALKGSSKKESVNCGGIS